MQGLLFLPCVPRQIVVGREGCTVALILVTEHTTSFNLNHSQWVFLEIIQTPMIIFNTSPPMTCSRRSFNAAGKADSLRAKVMQRRMLGGLG